MVMSPPLPLGLAADDASVPSDFSYYDQVLDTAVTLGAVPPRFADLLEDGALDLPGYFTLARGAGDRAPLEMTKWFDTNYLVPEISPQTEFRLADDRVVRLFLEAAAEGVTTRPVVVGPVTFLLLSKAVGQEDGDGAAPTAAPPEGFTPLDRLEDLLPVYVELLHELSQTGTPWVQLEEPALAVDWAVPRGIGFSHLVSLGDMLDVDFGDMLDWLATDSETTAILLYIEAITHSRKFMSAARAAARSAPLPAPPRCG